MPKLVIIDCHGDAEIGDIPPDCRSVIVTIENRAKYSVKVRYDKKEVDEKLRMEDYSK